MANLIKKHPELLQIDTFETVIHDTIPGISVNETLPLKTDFSKLDSLLNSYSTKIDGETLDLLRHNTKTVIYNYPVNRIDTIIQKDDWTLSLKTVGNHLQVDFIKKPKPTKKLIKYPQKTIVVQKGRGFEYWLIIGLAVFIIITNGLLLVKSIFKQ